MSLPTWLHDEVTAALGAAIEAAHSVGGGSINHTARLHLASGERAFIKWLRNPPPRFFACEAAGLKALREAAGDALHVPAVLGSGERWLLLEHIDEGPKAPAAEALGRGLAALHKAAQPRFGWANDNYIGTLPQPNGWAESWVDFYREKRLLPQMELLGQGGHLPPKRRTRLEQLMARLEDWLPHDAPPALLHGDLWSGNWLGDSQGRAVLIDPAVYVGHCEVDLAMLQLFGSPPAAFWQAYKEAHPLLPGTEERLPLYQLYYLMVHVVLFGEGYGSQTDAILARYGAM